MTNEQLNELVANLKKQKITPLQKYEETVLKYLTKRLADYDMPDYVKMEIAQFMAQQSIIFVHEQIVELQKDYVKQIKKPYHFRKNEP